MRHQQIKQTEAFEIVDPPAVIDLESGREPTRSERAAPDVPGAVGAMLVAVYILLVGMFALTIATAGKAWFMLVIDGAFLAAFFTVPYLFFRIERDPSRRPTLPRFLAEGMNTYTGHVSGAEALAQMFMVPGLLALAVLAMSIIAII